MKYPLNPLYELARIGVKKHQGFISLITNVKDHILENRLREEISKLLAKKDFWVNLGTWKHATREQIHNMINKILSDPIKKVMLKNNPELLKTEILKKIAYL